MDVLNALILEADRHGELTPLPGNNIKHRGSLYADDLVMFLAPTTRDFTCVQQILDLFAGVSGLSTNLHKCSITPIRCTPEQVQAVLAAFREFPLKYLGAPLSLQTQLKMAMGNYPLGTCCLYLYPHKNILPINLPMSMHG
jgi:hypothetical protein